MSFEEVRQKIQEASQRAGRKTEPTLVAVSKTKPVSEILDVYKKGQKVFGENYVQELIDKSKQIQADGLSDIQFHFVGHLQRNKVKALLPHVTCIHGVDSIRLLEEIYKVALAQSWKGELFLQVNVDDEESKSGWRPRELSDLREYLERTQLPFRPAGWMCIPDPARDPRGGFKKLKSIQERFLGSVGPGLSMGMSNDFEVAIEEGSTHVRVGSAIFGERTPRRK
jgi:pyridoxal phosphate enzyme (YggS family)